MRQFYFCLTTGYCSECNHLQQEMQTERQNASEERDDGKMHSLSPPTHLPARGKLEGAPPSCTRPASPQGRRAPRGEGGVRAHGLGAPSPTAATRAAGESRRRFARPARSCRAPRLRPAVCRRRFCPVGPHEAAELQAIEL